MCHLERLSKPFCEAYGVAIIEESRKRSEQKKNTHTKYTNNKNHTVTVKAIFILYGHGTVCTFSSNS